MKQEILLYSGTGNSFALIDCRAGLPFARGGEFARRIARDAGLDGLLVLTDDPHSGRPKLTIYNADGSRPEACGNGLRCVDGAALYRLPVQQPSGRVLTHAVEGTQAPASARLLPGSTWHFQAYFRDPAGGASGANLSDGISVEFTH